jgi:Pyruvate/2-oxoacid:ferredoxin oxidoreductase gamma subunit
MRVGPSKAKAVNVVIGGEAGQGLITVGDILTRTLVRAGYSVVVTQSYQSRIRGGHNTFTVRVGSEEILAPQEPIDILVALNMDTVHFHQHELSPQGTVLVDGKWGLEGNAIFAVPYDVVLLICERMKDGCAFLPIRYDHAWFSCGCPAKPCIEAFRAPSTLA